MNGIIFVVTWNAWWGRSTLQMEGHAHFR